MSKHDLPARPVFHHTRDAIEAHLTLVMAALAVARYLQDTTGISIKRITRTLKPLQDATTSLNGHHLAAADPPTPGSRKHPHHPQPQQDTKTIQLSCQGCAQRTQSVGVAVGLGEGPRPFPPVPVIMTRLQSWEATSSSTWKPSSAESNWA